MTGARSCHRERVAQNRAAKVRPVSEGLGEGVELGPEWAESRYSGGVAFRLGGQGVPRGVALERENRGLCKSGPV